MENTCRGQDIWLFILQAVCIGGQYSLRTAQHLERLKAQDTFSLQVFCMPPAGE